MNFTTKKRAPIQVLIIPFKRSPMKFCVFRRKDDKNWQWVAGGAYEDESPLDAAKREFHEETDIREYRRFLQLESVCSIPAENIVNPGYWKDIFVIKQFFFAVELFDQDEPQIGQEHIEYRWRFYTESLNLLKWDSNRCALTELYRKIEKGII
ncbi:hypothetical protein AMJ52_06610 [candidate division TA06 bacterium DG_78]|uniref:Nudix hydrolase domain-containing protein n=1 Tax=candidate division TA06 bacterium DG_78 TaxID=1703772 RepID=A0A0S7YC96_UNCT6|nr:MAG: hypothetical protein AMJ52_06610 [candidate division TA06 bacterium DG_78]